MALVGDRNLRVCAICGREIGARGYWRHLTSTHGRSADEARAIVDGSEAKPTREGQAIALTERLASLYERLDRYNQIAEHLPRPLLAELWSETMGDILGAADQLQALYPGEPVGFAEQRPKELPTDRQQALAAWMAIRDQVDIASDWVCSDHTVYLLGPMRRIGWLEATQQDVDVWRCELTPEGRRILGILDA